jgi:hypothetical protein
MPVKNKKSRQGLTIQVKSFIIDRKRDSRDDNEKRAVKRGSENIWKHIATLRRTNGGEEYTEHCRRGMRQISRRG